MLRRSHTVVAPVSVVFVEVVRWRDDGSTVDRLWWFQDVLLAADLEAYIAKVV